MIDWSQCPDAESVPDRCGGASVVKGTRILVQGILDNAEDCIPEEIAGPDIFPDLTVEQVRRMLRFAYQAQIDALYEQRRLRYGRATMNWRVRHKLAALDND